MRTIRNFARILIAPVFIFSGFVKAIDPLGFTYKISDYFEAFGMDFMMPASFVLAVLASSAELVIGLSLLLGVRMKVTSWALMVFMCFFTVLTFFIAITNPVTDCGCFGDAIILTNWQTFWKNIVFMIPTLIVFFNRRMFRPIASFSIEWGIVTLFALISAGISVITYTNLPFIDFRPYNVGTHIPSAMEIPEGAPVDEYDAFFIYEKNGEQKEFAATDIPYDDSAWKYVDRRTILVEEGYEPPIHDFSVSTLDGYDITDSILSDPGFSFLVVSYNLGKASNRGLKRINEFVATLEDIPAKVYGMTASTNSVINEVGYNHEFNYTYHITDEITLKTIIRSNPGLLLLKNGTIVGKWHYNNLPKVEVGEEQLLSMALHERENNKKKWVNGFFLLGLGVLMLLLILLVQRD